MTDRKAMQQALDALRLLVEERSYEAMDDGYKAITALRTAIAEAEKQEPVACRTLCELCVKRGYDFCANAAKTTPIITTPPAAQRPPLTDEAIWRQYQALWPFHPAEEPRLAKDIVKFARAIEAAHGIKEKNT
jgi:hypothetical protein